ncbi:2'-5'-oligoadenylate synthase 1A-like [Patiria miniata]|uniref:2'-5' oligoadenylate synthase n=1 Tax=Patiria miniata TaxID=46514 RepID=A0A913YZC5_PATMI|nr:2'-5'-oligoadenylate synthase 1A-like [Patiria miniata]XP_038044086.1 2'-5'-oligoadenylate synthase 1A-like [Patiria miniata]
MASANSEPWCLPPSKLEKWYNENVQKGTASFDATCREAVNDVVRSIQRICSTDGDMFNVSEIFKGGSLGKGTMVQNLSDVDLVAFINPPYLQHIHTVEAKRYRKQLRKVISKMKAALRKEAKFFTHLVKNISSSTFLVKFTIVVGDRPLKVDLLPTASIPPGVEGRALFETMMTRSSEDRELYSVSFAKSQVDFVKRQPGCVKELIRLVKNWAYTELPEELQKSYPLELITIFKWQRAGKPESFNKTRGLKDVLRSLQAIKALRTYHMAQYSCSKQLAKSIFCQQPSKGPIMLDPVNPTNNVFEIYQRAGNSKKISRAARKTLGSELLKNVTLASRRRKHWGDPAV